MENLANHGRSQGLSFQNQGNFFFEFQKGQGDLAWVWLRMHQHRSLCLIILENAWINCSEYASVLSMHDHLTYSTGFWRCLRFWIWYVCRCKGYRKFWICLVMAPYALVMSEYASICLNAPQYAWTWLNMVGWMSLSMAENAWTNCSDYDYARVLNIPRYSYKTL